MSTDVFNLAWFLTQFLAYFIWGCISHLIRKVIAADCPLAARAAEAPLGCLEHLSEGLARQPGQIWRVQEVEVGP